jgi:putative transposase
MDRSTTDARADVFDYIERFHSARIQRRIEASKRQLSVLTHPSALAG